MWDEYTLRLYLQNNLSDAMVTYLVEQARIEYLDELYDRERCCEPKYGFYEDSPPTDEEINAHEDREYRKALNISRDEKGRLKKGAVLAKKRNCDEDDLWSLYNQFRCSVKEIVALRGCSKSTVYNVIKKHKQKSGDK